MHVLTVIEKTIRIRKIKRPPRKDWSLKNIVGFVENTLPIRKQNKNKEKSDGWESGAIMWYRAGMFVPLPMAGADISNRPVALIGRASDSKSEGWGFESLLALSLIHI